MTHLRRQIRIIHPRRGPHLRTELAIILHIRCILQVRYEPPHSRLFYILYNEFKENMYVEEEIRDTRSSKIIAIF